MLRWMQQIDYISRSNFLAQHDWTREEDLAVLYLREKYKVQLTRNHPSIKALGKAMGLPDDSSSIWRRKGNFDYLDDSVPGGMSNASQKTKDVWAEYQSNPDSTLAKARKAYLNLVQDTI